MLDKLKKCGNVQIKQIAPAVGGRKYGGGKERGLRMNPALRRALRSAILSAGAWAERFDNSTLTWYPPHMPAGIRALRRAGRPDLIPALRKRASSGRWDTWCLKNARWLASLLGGGEKNGGMGRSDEDAAEARGKD